MPPTTLRTLPPLIKNEWIFRRHGRPLLFMAFAVLIFFVSLNFRPVEAQSSSQSKEIFTDITEEAGISWRQFSGESQDRFLIETMGGGVAFLDFDGDGLQDLFFVNGGETPHGKSSSPIRNALYRNLGNGKFQEVAAKAGVDRLSFYGMGVAAGDLITTAFLTCTSRDFLAARSFTTTATERSPM